MKRSVSVDDIRPKVDFTERSYDQTRFSSNQSNICNNATQFSSQHDQYMNNAKKNFYERHVDDRTWGRSLHGDTVTSPGRRFRSLKESSSSQAYNTVSRFPYSTTGGSAFSASVSSSLRPIIERHEEKSSSQRNANVTTKKQCLDFAAPVFGACEIPRQVDTHAFMTQLKYGSEAADTREHGVFTQGSNDKEKHLVENHDFQRGCRSDAFGGKCSDGQNLESRARSEETVQRMTPTAQGCGSLGKAGTMRLSPRVYPTPSPLQSCVAGDGPWNGAPMSRAWQLDQSESSRIRPRENCETSRVAESNGGAGMRGESELSRMGPAGVQV